MAGPNDFTGQNIQDTYQRVLQISSSSQITDGTGSVVQTLNVTASYAISASHEITYELSSSYAETASVALKTQNALTVGTGLDLSNSAVNWTGQYGRTVTLDLTEVIDTDGLDRLLSTNADGTLTAHSGLSFDGTSLIGSGSETGLETTGFISCSTMIVDGQITASGNISASGDVYAESIILPFGQAINWGAHDGNHISVDSGTGNIIFDTLPVQMGNGLNVTGTNSHITASGNISSSGIVTGEHLASSDGISATTYVSVGTLTNGIQLNGLGLTTLGTMGNITASGNISASGDMIAKTYDAKTSGTGYKLSGAKVVYTHDNATILGGSTTTAITGSSIILGRTAVTHVTASGNISASGEIYSNNIEKAFYTFQLANTANADTWYGPNSQGPYYYYWNKSYASYPNTGLSNHTSGYVLPCKAELISTRFVIHPTSTSPSCNASASVIVLSSDDFSYPLETSPNSDLRVFQPGTVSGIDTRYGHYEISNGEISGSYPAGTFIYPRIRLTEAGHSFRGYWELSYRKIK